MWQCPFCSDWICLDDDPDSDGWPNCMIHENDSISIEWVDQPGAVCADCCDDDCSICDDEDDD